MRILAIADIHGIIEVYEWLPKAVSDYGADALIIAGDLLTGGWEGKQSEHARTFVIPRLKADLHKMQIRLVKRLPLQPNLNFYAIIRLFRK